MERSDVPVVFRLLNQYLKRFDQFLRYRTMAAKPVCKQV